VIFSASQQGKDLAPRLGAKLGAGVAADCTALSVNGADIVATRPIYAGKAMVSVKVVSPVKIFTLRPNVFTASPVNGGTASVEACAVDLSDADFAAKATSVKIAEGRPDVTEASIIVSGGRGMKGPEHFHLVETLADVLGGAVGASRAVVDAGWRPHDEQVGQTGKTVSPSLYVACGISGAVQHIAISVPRDRWEQLRERLDEAGVEYVGPDRGIPESMYFRDPDGIGLELLSDPLMYFAGRQLDE